MTLLVTMALTIIGMVLYWKHESEKECKEKQISIERSLKVKDVFDIPEITVVQEHETIFIDHDINLPLCITGEEYFFGVQVDENKFDYHGARLPLYTEDNYPY